MAARSLAAHAARAHATAHAAGAHAAGAHPAVPGGLITAVAALVAVVVGLTVLAWLRRPPLRGEVRLLTRCRDGEAVDVQLQVVTRRRLDDGALRHALLAFVNATPAARLADGARRDALQSELVAHLNRALGRPHGRWPDLPVRQAFITWLLPRPGRLARRPAAAPAAVAWARAEPLARGQALLGRLMDAATAARSAPGPPGASAADGDPAAALPGAPAPAGAATQPDAPAAGARAAPGPDAASAGPNGGSAPGDRRPLAEPPPPAATTSEGAPSA